MYRSVLQFQAIMELLEACLRTAYFQVDDKFFEQKDGVTTGGSLSPIVSNIYIKHFEKLALDSAQRKPSLAPVCLKQIHVLASWSRAVTEFPQLPQ
jgi:hypothetical protein